VEKIERILSIPRMERPRTGAAPGTRGNWHATPKGAKRARIAGTIKPNVQIITSAVCARRFADAGIEPK
jgi:hypothetical protein